MRVLQPKTDAKHIPYYDLAGLSWYVNHYNINPSFQTSCRGCEICGTRLVASSIDQLWVVHLQLLPPQHPYSSPVQGSFVIRTVTFTFSQKLNETDVYWWLKHDLWICSRSWDDKFIWPPYKEIHTEHHPKGLLSKKNGRERDPPAVSFKLFSPDYTPGKVGEVKTHPERAKSIWHGETVFGQRNLIKTKYHNIN